jgi:peptidoglycan glycosyltransferase
VRVIDPVHATALAEAMRQVVTSGTGRSVANAVVPVAGKTGTAQVDRAASHSWFIGFAPFDRDGGGDSSAGKGAARGDNSGAKGTASAAGGRSIAFAVLLENAGYGARAAPVVADVVRAARELDIIRDR